VSSTQRRGAAGAGEDEDETGKGSRVYLPSRSEAEEEAALAASASASSSGLGASALLDIDDHPEDIILDLDIDTKAKIHNFGWRFALKPDIERQMRGSGSGGKGGAAAAMTIQDLTGEDLVLESVILDKNGEPTERWTISGAQWVGDYPTRFPDGWLSGMLVYPDDSPIAPSDMVEELRKTRKPLNWVRAIITLIEKRITRKSRSAYEKNNDIMDENSRNIAANAKELERVSSEIERAKREGNVAEEERLKVQMTRLTDERTTLNALRRDIEFSSGNEEAAEAAEYEPKTPGYSSSWDYSPVAPGGGGGVGAADDANRLRGAVASFNEKMLEKYGKDDDNIPSASASEPSEPSEPRTPAYSSMFEGGGQRGGASKFIPQIPTGVLESYLSSRGGAAMNPAPSAVPMNPFQQMGGGAGGSNLGSMMGATMNVPVVATMPMAGMMPVQAQGGGGGMVAVGNMPGQPQAQQPAAQTGGAAPPMASPTPNEAGVKTFSINLHR
jgi:hypothetical protein